eukprot:scaffold2240_cov172-Ochromonas_danica.AAC.15
MEIEEVLAVVHWILSHEAQVTCGQSGDPGFHGRQTTPAPVPVPSLKLSTTKKAIAIMGRYRADPRDCSCLFFIDNWALDSLFLTGLQPMQRSSNHSQGLTAGPLLGQDEIHLDLKT